VKWKLGGVGANRLVNGPSQHLLQRKYDTQVPPVHLELNGISFYTCNPITDIPSSYTRAHIAHTTTLRPIVQILYIQSGEVCHQVGPQHSILIHSPSKPEITHAKMGVLLRHERENGGPDDLLGARRCQTRRSLPSGRCRRENMIIQSCEHEKCERISSSPWHSSGVRSAASRGSPGY
jgi:hypothetical protein